MKKFLYSADVCLPDFSKIDGQKWASVACDQFTSQPSYWEEAYKFADGSPSTLNLILPEAYLSQSADRIPLINANMRAYLKDVLICHKNSMIYLERTQSDGKIRRGIVGAIDLEEYDYSKGSQSLIRATEGTVLERIPPRVEIRRGAEIELPHIMVLIDDKEKSVIEPIARRSSPYRVAYDFDLMLGGGHVCGKFIPEEEFENINKSLSNLASNEKMLEKYGIDASPLLFAMGDGNHSLACAKALYEEIKAEIGDKAKNHPSRYALCEVVNLHDEALEFEPIYRVLFGVDAKNFICELSEYANSLCGSAKEQKINYVCGDCFGEVVVKSPVSQLAVGTVQNFIDKYIKSHDGVTVDYIHGIEAVRSLCQNESTVGLTFDGMSKEDLFRAVIYDGALPKKTFSMGHAEDKRYYIESRKII